MWLCPYRKPTPVGRGTTPKVSERTSVKELGKLTPYLWKKGRIQSFGGMLKPRYVVGARALDQ